MHRLSTGDSNASRSDRESYRRRSGYPCDSRAGRERVAARAAGRWFPGWLRIPGGGSVAGIFRRLVRALRSAPDGFAVDEATSSIASMRSLSHINHHTRNAESRSLLAGDYFRTTSRRLENDFVGTPKNPPVLAGGLSLFVCIIAETCQSQKRDCLKGIADWLTAGYRRSRRRWFLLAALFALAARCLG
jgi:hypothetical protein